jgi:flagellar motor switch protein FliN/FliY
MDNRLGQDTHTPHDVAMVLDLTFKAEVLLGQADLPLGSLMDLSPGQVLELDNRAHQPLDLVVNGALVAKGEIVIMDDRYGLRLTHIVSPSERSCATPYPSD